MPTALVIHAEHDRRLVEDEVVSTLAINGFRAELTSAAATAKPRGAQVTVSSWPRAIDLFVIVVSKQAQACSWMVSTVGSALRHEAMVLPLLVDETSPVAIHKGLAHLVHADFRLPGPAARHQLANLLPRSTDTEPVDIRGWREDLFYEQLARSVRTFQYGQAADLIDTATQQIERHNLECSGEGACRILNLLAGNRYWPLIRHFAEALMPQLAMQHPPFTKLYERLALEEQRAVEQVEKMTPTPVSPSAIGKPANTHAAGANQQGLPILIRVNDPDWSNPHIPDLTIASRIGTIISGIGSSSSLVALQQDPRVLSFERSRPVAVPECDRSIAFVRGHAVHTSRMSERGDQALVAVIDDGIDPLHAAFMDADGNSRIIAVWDQTDDSGSPPAGFSTGTEYREAAIGRFVASGRLPESWPLGRHGTHVASIAAGRAVADGFAGGMAPQAKIVMVVPRIETDGCAFSYANALCYIEKICSEENLPVTVNISFGDNAGAHDGSSHLESCVDAFSRGGWQPGRVIVTSAGNERRKDLHARVRLRSQSTALLKWQTHQLPREDDELGLR